MAMAMTILHKFQIIGTRSSTTFVEGLYRCHMGRKIIISPQSVIQRLGRGDEPNTPYPTWRALELMCIDEVYLEKDWPFSAKKPRNYFAKRIYLNGFQTIHGEKAIQEALDKKLPVMCCVAAHESLASYKWGILDTQKFYGRTCMTYGEDVWSLFHNCGYGEGFYMMCLTGHGIFKGKQYWRAQNSGGETYGEK
ncbi:uncharacterized protein LOC109949445 [Prunus persica]|uniref:uncharacterized protein LOC109949445 n=1 Tax=Prunus persica TaxID=3760 RepID=UPI0009AB6AD1|nr:uncharacterized protein LOC109949445 [Prunus persica]